MCIRDSLFTANEAFATVISSLNYLTTLCNVILESRDYDGSNENELDLVNKEYLLGVFRKRGVISHIKILLSKGDAPLLFYSSVVRFLRVIVNMEPRGGIAVIGQCETWELLVSLYSFEYKMNRCLLLEAQRAAPGTEVANQVLLLVFEITQIITFAASVEKQIGDFLIDATPLIGNLLTWLVVLAAVADEKHVDSEIYQETAFVLTHLLHHLLMYCEDKAVFYLNQKFETPSVNFKLLSDILPSAEAKSNLDGRTNVFTLIPNILNRVESIQPKVALLKLVGALLPKWTKGWTEDEDCADGIVLGAKVLLQQLEQPQPQSGSQDRGTLVDDVLLSLASIISMSLRAKFVFLNCGFFGQIVHEISRRLDRQTIPTHSNSRKLDRSSSNVSMLDPESARDIALRLKVLQSLCFFDADVDSREVQAFFNKKSLESLTALAEILDRIAGISTFCPELLETVYRIVSNISFVRDSQLAYSLVTKNNFIGKVLNTILKGELASRDQFKSALEFIASLLHNQEVRNVLMREKLVEALSSKFVRFSQKRKEFTLSNHWIKDILRFFSVVSFYKDLAPRISHESNSLELAYELWSHTSFQDVTIATLFANLGGVQACKPFFKNQPVIVATALAQLSHTRDSSKTLKLRFLASQFILNLLWKNNSALAMINKPDIKDVLTQLQKTVDREAEQSDQDLVKSFNSNLVNIIMLLE
eukprot:TRINITY_DN3548_c0_g1_i6.p1 TRINITY_DN3548_c0_g1~~TRINITY_DN3548_c0_g1_i6.p1  ORF type:complete len:704 (+),score=183.03 TRINITY_DN3548_c0_g1_i6:67-2178(+)